jgi:hypothetical protein
VHKRDFCQADGTFARLGGLPDSFAAARLPHDIVPATGTVIYSKARRRLNPRTGRVVLKLQLNKAGRKLFKQTSGSIDVNVRFTLQTGGQQSRLTRFLTLFGTKK